MTTKQATGNEQQQRKQLGWLLDTMIEQLETAPPESALGGIEQYEVETAELIESTGLADKAGIPVELRPVIHREEVEYHTEGLDEFAKLVEEHGGGKVEITDKSFPTYISFRYVTPGCHINSSRFSWFAASGLGSELQQEGLHDEPDTRYIKGLVACLKGWRARNNEPSKQGETIVNEITAKQAGGIWERSESWWRARVGDGKPIPQIGSAKNGAKKFSFLAADKFAKEHDPPINRRKHQTR